MSPSWPETQSACLCLPYAMIIGPSHHTQFKCAVDLPSWLPGRFRVHMLLVALQSQYVAHVCTPSTQIVYRRGLQVQGQPVLPGEILFQTCKQKKEVRKYTHDNALVPLTPRQHVHFTESKHYLWLEVCRLWMSSKKKKKRQKSGDSVFSLQSALVSFCCLERRKSVSSPSMSHSSACSFPLELSQFSGQLVSFPVTITKSSDQTRLPVGGIVHHGWEDMVAGA